MYALEHRQQLSGRSGWMLASGIVDLILAAIIFAGLSGHCGMGARIVCRNQHALRQFGPYRDGLARPRERSG